MRFREEIKREIKSPGEMADLFVQLRVTIGGALLRGKSWKRVGGRAENWNRVRRVVSRKVIHSCTRGANEDREKCWERKLWKETYVWRTKDFSSKRENRFLEEKIFYLSENFRDIQMCITAYACAWVYRFKNIIAPIIGEQWD